MKPSIHKLVTDKIIKLIEVNETLLWVAQQELQFSTCEWLTYKQAQYQGLQVRKGEKATPVVFYKTLSIKDLETDEDKNIPLLKTYSVFNRDQLDGEEPENNDIPTQQNIESYIDNIPFIAEIGEPAFYPALDIVKMPNIDKFQTSDSYYSIHFHELVHWTGHPTRLDRVQSTDKNTKEYAFEELIAELGSAFLSAQFGINREIRHASYIKSWVKLLKGDDKAIFKAAAAASKACELLNSYQISE